MTLKNDPREQGLKQSKFGQKQGVGAHTPSPAPKSVTDCKAREHSHSSLPGDTVGNVDLQKKLITPYRACNVEVYDHTGMQMEIKLCRLCLIDIEIQNSAATSVI